MSASPTLAELEQARANLEAMLRAVRAKVCPEGANSSKSTLDALDELIDEHGAYLVRAVHLRGELRAAYVALEQALDWAKCDHERAHKHGEKPGRVEECADNLAVPATVCGWRRRVEALEEVLSMRRARGS